MIQIRISKDRICSYDCQTSSPSTDLMKTSYLQQTGIYVYDYWMLELSLQYLIIISPP